MNETEETKIKKVVSKNKNKIGEGGHMETRERILEGTLAAFNQKGLKFTMDDVARQLEMSKKTIYTVFKDKEELLLATVDYMFDRIKESEQRVLNNNQLSTEEKIRVILGVMPESYKDIDFRQLYLLKEKYPITYRRVELRLETGWESTIELLEQGIAEGVIRPILIPILKMMLEAVVEQFFQRDVLIQNHLSYIDALNEVVNILMDGITVK